METQIVKKDEKLHLADILGSNPKKETGNNKDVLSSTGKHCHYFVINLNEVYKKY